MTCWNCFWASRDSMGWETNLKMSSKSVKMFIYKRWRLCLPRSCRHLFSKLLWGIQMRHFIIRHVFEISWFQFQYRCFFLSCNLSLKRFHSVGVYWRWLSGWTETGIQSSTRDSVIPHQSLYKRRRLKDCFQCTPKQGTPAVLNWTTCCTVDLVMSLSWHLVVNI